MSKRAPIIEWYIAESDADWERWCARPLPDDMLTAAPAAPAHSWSKQVCWGAMVMLLLLMGAGGWWWHTTQARWRQAEAEHQATVQRELAAAAQRDDTETMYWQYHLAQQESGLYASDQPAAPAAHLNVTLDAVEIQGDRAVVRVVLHASNSEMAQRQTRFYRRVATGWLQTAPDAELWGPERSLATPSFVFHFRQNDAAAVIAIAPQIEALYTTIWQNFGLSITPNTEKLVIEVSVTQTPEYTSPWFGVPDRIIVPSPAVYLAPVELTDADLLAQSIALPLLAQVLAQANEHHAVKTAWQPMLNGLYLWHVWNLDLPLATWREDGCRQGD